MMNTRPETGVSDPSLPRLPSSSSCRRGALTTAAPLGRGPVERKTSSAQASFCTVHQVGQETPGLVHATCVVESTHRTLIGPCAAKQTEITLRFMQGTLRDWARLKRVSPCAWASNRKLCLG